MQIIDADKLLKEADTTNKIEKDGEIIYEV